MPDLYQELNKLADSEMYPFHMPGHKRNVESTPMKGAFRCDITEIDGFDNLHDAEGIIKSVQDCANELYKCDDTFILVNGSTCGVLSAVSAALDEGEVILAARGSHKSFYNAVYLRHLDIKYLPYKINSLYGIPEGYTKEDVEQYLTEDVKCVFITSPTYEGKCSDVKGIAQLCHKKGIPLIVDAAHGAHFGFHSSGKYNKDIEYTEVPESAATQGADLVIHSLHKTLPAMTQTALLHLNRNLIDKNRLKRFLKIYQSSSPSYILMSSIDLCIKYMESSGTDFIDRLLYYRNKIQNETQKCKILAIPGKNILNDPSKVVIYVKNHTITGQRLYDILREEYCLQMEMAGERFALAIISGWDTEEGINRLINAVNNIDKKLSENSEIDVPEINTEDMIKVYRIPERAMSLNQAWDMSKETVSLHESRNRISGEFVNLYPPGIPILVPGEIISEEIINEVSKYLNNKMNVQGVIERKDFLCVKQK